LEGGQSPQTEAANSITCVTRGNFTAILDRLHLLLVLITRPAHVVFLTHYASAGVGDFNGDGTCDILFRNTTTGDTWYKGMLNGAFNGWHQIGGSNTSYTSYGAGDFYGNGVDDPLFRNTATGDTWFQEMSNGAFKAWHQIGGSDTRYGLVGMGDFNGSDSTDILYRNNSTDILFRNSAGDMWV
jgi:hypothetical protein